MQRSYPKELPCVELYWTKKTWLDEENDKWTRVTYPFPLSFYWNVDGVVSRSYKLPQLQIIARKTDKETKSRSLQYLSGLAVNGLIYFLLGGRHQNKHYHIRNHVWKLSDSNSPLPRGSMNEWWLGIDSQVCRSWVTDAGKVFQTSVLSPPTPLIQVQTLNSDNHKALRLLQDVGAYSV